MFYWENRFSSLERCLFRSIFCFMVCISDYWVTPPVGSGCKINSIWDLWPKLRIQIINSYLNKVFSDTVNCHTYKPVWNVGNIFLYSNYILKQQIFFFFEKRNPYLHVFSPTKIKKICPNYTFTPSTHLLGIYYVVTFLDNNNCMKGSFTI